MSKPKLKTKSEISTNQRRLDVRLIHDFLRSSYWAKDIPRSIVKRSFKNSLCFGAYQGKQQVGFGRVVTDRATFAYMADVFVIPEHRGRGVAQRLVRAMLKHPELQGLRRFLLATKDAHKLYEKFGFEPITQPENYLSIHHPDIYRKHKKK